MARKQQEVEDALFQIKNLEESLQKNAQGILSSTMKEEISSLVKESLKEQDEVDDEDEEEVDVDIEDTDTDNEEDTDDDEYAIDTMGDDEMMGQTVMPSDDDTIDMTGASDAEVLRVFRAMGDNDGVVVKRDDNMIHLSDNENDTEYIIQLSESMMDDSELKEFGKSEYDLYDFHHSEDEDDFSFEDEDDFSFDDEEDDFDFSFDDELEGDDFMAKARWNTPLSDYDEDEDDSFTIKPKHMRDMDDDFSELGEEQIYELELDDLPKGEQTSKFSFAEDADSDEFDLDDSDSEYLEFDEDEDPHASSITLKPELEKEMAEARWMHESKKGFKAKGMGMGSASKYKMSKKPNMDGGFKTVKKKVNKTMGTGKAKFEYKEEVNVDGFDKKPSMKKKIETKEAARTRGNGDRFREGGLPKPRAHSSANINIKKGRMNEEVEQLREKNEEYRRALDLFRTKLNEVAVFNSNLAYATRLFTEHSTTKQEKINILKRFDNVETLKESKNLYRAIKDEIGNEKVGGESTITESIQRTVSRTPETGSAVNLIESKTYENPQFLRMKDLMAKIK